MENIATQSGNIMTSGPTSGTPINMLMNQESQESHHQQQQQQTMYNQQMLQQQAIMQQQQHLMQQQMQNRSKVNPSISNLVTDINNSLDNNNTNNSTKPMKNNDTKKKGDDTDDTEETEDEDSEEIVVNKSQSRIPNTVKELVLFVTLYYIMSSGTIKKTLGTYIKYINPNSEGDVSFVGILIYGMLLGSMFLALRKFVLS